MTEQRSDATVAELIGRVSSRLRQSMGTAMDTADMGGLTPYQGRIVGFIEANEAKGLIARDLADMTGTRAASVSSLLQGLERDGWIERRPDPADSRRKTLHVTPKGRDQVKRFEAGLWSGIETRIDDAFDDADRATLIDLLGRLDRHLAD